MNGHGFIFSWRRVSKSGLIQVTSDNSPVGNRSIVFLGEDVTDQSLRNELGGGNINPANGSIIHVRFRFGNHTNGERIAVDVQRF